MFGAILQVSLAFLLGVYALAVGLFVFVQSKGRTVALWLLFALALLTIDTWFFVMRQASWIASDAGLWWFPSWVVKAALVGNQVTVAMFSSAYLLFVGHAIKIPATHWIRQTSWAMAIVSFGILLLVAVIVDFYLGNAVTNAVIIWMSIVVNIGVTTFGLVAAILALKASAIGSPQRRRMRWYLAAFGVRDVYWIIGNVAFAIYFFMSQTRLDWEPLWFFILAGWWTHIIANIFFVGFLSIGVLKGVIIDLDRKVHFTISRTTIAAIFIAVFIGVQTAVSEFAASAWGWVAAGVAAGALVFAMAPLQRVAERVADKAVPQGRSSSKMSKQERQLFYREQVEIAYSDGSIGSKERKTLQNVRERLGLSGAVALKIEDAVVA